MLDVADSTSPERAREIQLRLRRPQNAVEDRGIDLSRKGSVAVKSRDDNLFFVPKPTPSARLLQRLQAEKAGIVPNNWSSDHIILHSKCGASFLLVPQLRPTAQEVTGGDVKISRATITEVLHAVARATQNPFREIISARRTADIVVPRHLTAYLCRRLTLKSLPEIGHRLGGRDHTTILNSIRRLQWLDTALILSDSAPVQEWAEQSWALVQEHGVKGPQP